MPSVANEYIFPEASKEDLPYAELVSVDLSDIDTEEGKARQAKNLIEAITKKGFFYVKGYDIPKSKIVRQYALGKQFYDLPLETKLKYQPDDLGLGGYNGYRPAGRRIMLEDAKGILHDQTEVYNIPQFGQDFKQDHPSPLAENVDQIQEFEELLKTKILDPLYRLTSLGLEVPEDTFSKIHDPAKKSESHFRYMKYTHYSEEDTERLGGLWGQGHTDLGSYTLLFAQPVAALQIRDANGQWYWVKHEPDTFTVNACDALQALTGNFIQSTIHRVRAPPKDQAHLDRLGILFFDRAANGTVLSTIDSPLLKRLGYTKNNFEQADSENVPTVEQLVVAKQAWQQSKGKYDIGKQILPGLKGTFYA